MSTNPSPSAEDFAACARALGDGQSVLTLTVTPNAPQTEVMGVRDGALRLKLAAAPIEGQANAALTAWLAKALGLAKREVRLRRGGAARHKQIELDAPLTAVQAWLRRQAS